MGLLASSKRSHDFADSSPEDNTDVYQNGCTGRRRSGKASGTRTPVRLVRSRTLSTDMSQTITPDYGSHVESAVLQNGHGSWSMELKRLLVDTQPVVRWQEPLKCLLQAYIVAKDAFRALDFLAEHMDTAIAAIRNPPESLGFPALFIDVRHKPIIFDVNHWKRIMIALHFELTEAGSGLDMGLIELTVTQHVTVGSLLGFKLLMQNLSNISWGMLRMLLTLTADEGRRFMIVIQEIQGHGHHHGPRDTAIIQDLYARNPEQLSFLGFRHTKLKKKKEVTWHPDQISGNILHHVEVSLMGLFHNGSGLETYV